MVENISFRERARDKSCCTLRWYFHRIFITDIGKRKRENSDIFCQSRTTIISILNIGSKFHSLSRLKIGCISITHNGFKDFSFLNQSIGDALLNIWKSLRRGYRIFTRSIDTYIRIASKHKTVLTRIEQSLWVRYRSLLCKRKYGDKKERKRKKFFHNLFKKRCYKRYIFYFNLCLKKHIWVRPGLNPFFHT